MINHHANKRKNDDDASSSTTSAMSFMNTSNYQHHRTTNSTNNTNTFATVVYSPRNSNAAHNWTQCKNRLHTLLQHYINDNIGIDYMNQQDPVMDDIATISTHSMMKRTILDLPLLSKLQKADQIVSTIESDIQQIMKQVQNVSTVVSTLQSQYDVLQTDGTNTLDEIHLLQQQQHQHEQHIQQYRTTIARYQQEFASTKQSMYHNVPRLQHMISLYVTMTGIKWKYDDNVNDAHPYGGSNNNNADGVVTLTGEIVRTVFYIPVHYAAIHVYIYINLTILLLVFIY